jgi:hypothetical protein
MCDLIKCAIIFGIIYYIYQNNKTAKQTVIVPIDDNGMNFHWESPPYLRNRYLPTVN